MFTPRSKAACRAHIRTVSRVPWSTIEVQDCTNGPPCRLTHPCHRSGCNDPHRGRRTTPQHTGRDGAHRVTVSPAHRTCAALAALCPTHTLPRKPAPLLTCHLPALPPSARRWRVWWPAAGPTPFPAHGTHIAKCVAGARWRAEPQRVQVHGEAAERRPRPPSSPVRWLPPRERQRHQGRSGRRRSSSWIRRHHTTTPEW
jgi:hypothetical protein